VTLTPANRSGVTENELMKKSTNKNHTPNTSLVGMYFHQLKLNEHGEMQIHWQGQIIGRPQPAYYLLQLYDWLVGAPSDCRIVEFQELRGWLFYPDAEGMRYAYEYGSARMYKWETLEKNRERRSKAA
jgi:hypothetical protein